jgi:hypothetical protein
MFMQKPKIRIERSFLYLKKFHFSKPNHDDKNRAHEIPENLMRQNEDWQSFQKNKAQKHNPQNIENQQSHEGQKKNFYSLCKFYFWN